MLGKSAASKSSSSLLHTHTHIRAQVLSGEHLSVNFIANAAVLVRFERFHEYLIRSVTLNLDVTYGALAVIVGVVINNNNTSLPPAITESD